jgi:hypothetical protein
MAFEIPMPLSTIGLLGTNFVTKLNNGDYKVVFNEPASKNPAFAKLLNAPPDARLSAVFLDPEHPTDNFIGAAFRLPSEKAPFSNRKSVYDRLQFVTAGSVNPAFIKTDFVRTLELAGGYNLGTDKLGARGLFNFTIGGIAVNPWYVSTGDFKLSDGSPGKTLTPAKAASIAPANFSLANSFVVGPVALGERFFLGRGGIVGTGRLPDGVNLRFGIFTFPRTPVIYNNPAWTDKSTEQLLDRVGIPRSVLFGEPSAQPLEFKVTSPQELFSPPDAAPRRAD